jgi:SAM-dependent methyltransferase
MNWKSAQKAEKASWNIEDEATRIEKIERETARYPKLRIDMGLDRIRTDNKILLEIGGGPIGVIYDMPAKQKYIVEPLTEEYKEYWPCPYHMSALGEDLPFDDEQIDLVLISNALDHCEDPQEVLEEVKRVLRPGGFLAVNNCTDLASIHKHPGHLINIDEFWFHNQIDADFETVHELTFRRNGYRYGWVKYDGKVGQPAWVGLYRKVTGY